MKKWIVALMVGLLLVFTVPVMAIGQDVVSSSGEKQLTVQTAYELAANNSTVLRQAALAVDRAKEVRNVSMNVIEYIPSGPSPAAGANAWTSAVMADINWQMASKSKSVAEDKLYLSVVDKYNNLFTAQENLGYSQKSLRQAQAQDRINNLSLALGMTSGMQYKINYATLETAKLSVQNAQITLDKAYLDFNNLLGLGISERPVLSDQPSFEPLQVDNVENTINRILDADPTVWMKEQSADLASLNLDLYNYSSTSTYTAEKIDVDIADLSVQETKKQMEQLMRTLYNSMQQLEESYKMKQQAVIIAQQTLEMKKKMFEVGMVSRIDLDQSELDAAKAQLDLDQLSCSYQSLKLSFAKPWAN